MLFICRSDKTENFKFSLKETFALTINHSYYTNENFSPFINYYLPPRFKALFRLHFLTMSAPHRDYFLYNRLILRFAGLWQPDHYATPLQKILYNTYATFTFLFVNVFFTTTEFISLYETRHDLYALIKNINFALTHLMGAVKCCFWFFRHKKLLKIIATLESGDDASGAAIMQRYRRKGVVFTLAFFVLAHLTLASSYLPPLVAAVKYDGNGGFKQNLPYFSWMPFDYSTRGRFLLAMGYQAVPMFSYAYSIVGMDTLFMNMMNFIVAHLVVVQRAFKTIRRRCVEKVGANDPKELNRAMMGEMKTHIRHLQTIFKSVLFAQQRFKTFIFFVFVFRVRDELEAVHKYLTLGQLTATLFILCTCLFLVSTVSRGNKTLNGTLIYCTMGL